MTGIVERLRNISRGDHERGCQGREYVCSCDYDETSWKTAEEAAAEIDRLRRELEEARKALAPFARAADRCKELAHGLPVVVNINECRAARAALRAGEEGR